MQPTEYSFNFLAEIQDEIIDHLSDQPHALRNCALTCQRWTRCAQMHIFREIPVLDHGRLVRIEHLLEASPYIARFVRVLTLSKHYTSLPQFDYAWAKLFTHMDRLEELNIGKLSRMSLPDFRDGLTTYLSRLRILRFTSVYDIDCDDFLSLLAACPSLVELYASDSFNIRPNYAGPINNLGIPPAPATQTLRSLTIGASLSGSSISCLSFYFELQTSLRRLQLSYRTVVAPECKAFLLQIAPTLEELVVRSHHHLPLVPIFQSPFRCLRYLHLKHIGLEEELSEIRQPNWIINMLDHISQWDQRLVLQEIVLSMPLSRKQEWWRDYPGWDSLGTGFPFPWVQLDMSMAKLAEENSTLVFSLNISGPWKKTRKVSLTDKSFGQYRLRVSKTEELRPQALKVLIGPYWSTFGVFGGRLSDIPTLTK
ncbi:hypothetical protein C8Q72DRAFT_993735 [Fomitopsis betulina]|nr:hypothetical protein C8Q72DRAFT_993735 [Fomitopsis betulina]